MATFHPCQSLLERDGSSLSVISYAQQISQSPTGVYGLLEMAIQIKAEESIGNRVGYFPGNSIISQDGGK
jgi:hypothetical protein